MFSLGKELSVEEGSSSQPNLVSLKGSDLYLDEPWQDLRGFDVYDINDDQIGSVEDVYVDREETPSRQLVNRQEDRSPISVPPSSFTLAPLSFRAWLAAKRALTAVLLALRPAGLDPRFPVPALRLAGLGLRFPGLARTSTLLLGRLPMSPTI